MSTAAAVNVFSTNVSSNNASRHELLAWVNKTINFNYSKVEEMCSGAAYCKLVDKLFPNVIPLKKVKMQTNQEHEFISNLKILQSGFSKLSVQKVIPIERMAKARFQDNFEFLQWFHKFYLANAKAASTKAEPDVKPKSVSVKKYEVKIPKDSTFVAKTESEVRANNAGKTCAVSRNDSNVSKVSAKNSVLKKTKFFTLVSMSCDPPKTGQAFPTNKQYTKERGADGDVANSLARQRTMNVVDEDKLVNKLCKQGTFITEDDHVNALPRAVSGKETIPVNGRLPTSLKYMYEREPEPEPEPPRRPSNATMNLINLDEDGADSNYFQNDYEANEAENPISPHHATNYETTN